MEQSKAGIRKTFTQEGELNEKVARLNELNVQLDLENGKTEMWTSCEEQDNARVAEPDSYHAFRLEKRENDAEIMAVIFIRWDWRLCQSPFSIISMGTKRQMN